GVADLAVRLDVADFVVVVAAGADDELADAPRGVGVAVRVLGGEPFVDVLVAGEDDLGAGVVERGPERRHVIRAAMLAARTEAGMMPVGERAAGWMGGQIGAEPTFLRRSRVAAADFVAVRIEGDDVPAAEVVTVVAGRRVAGR